VTVCGGWRRQGAALLACAAASAALPVRAAWTPVDGTESSYDYVDLSSLRVEGTVRARE